MLFVILVGNIGTGKSTFAKSLNLRNKIVICPDNYSGSDIEQDYQFTSDIENAKVSKMSIIIDGPHIKKYDRANILRFNMPQENYIPIAIDFGVGDNESLNNRKKELRKLSSTVWEEVHNNNLKDYESPTKEEGFYRVIKCVSKKHSVRL